MKYNFSTKIKALDGKPMLLEPNSKIALDAKIALQFALIQDKPNNENTKMERYNLYIKLGTANEKTDFNAEEVKHLKDAALTQATIVAGQLVHLLDQRK